MYVKEEDIKDNGDNYKAKNPCHEMTYEQLARHSEVTQNIPQIQGSECTNIENNEQTNKFNREDTD